MALIGGAPPAASSGSAETFSAQFSLACCLYQNGAYADAYRLFLALSKEKTHPIVLLNLGLCYLSAQEWQYALNTFEKIPSLIKQQHLGTVLPNDTTYGALLSPSGKSDGYRMPLPETAADYAPEYALSTVQRLMIDCCVQLDLWDRVRSLAGPLRGKHYANVEQALALASGK